MRALSRSPKNAARLRDVASEVVLADATRPAELAGVFDGIDIVVSCLGANVSLSLRERRGFFSVDVPANTNMLEAAKDRIFVMINRATARQYWGDKDPLDAYGRFNSPEGTRFQVIGIVEDIRNDGLGKPTVLQNDANAAAYGEY